MSADLFSAPLPQRFWDKVIPEPNSGCWLWTATIAENGYGRFGIGPGKHKPAHRIAYLALVGPVSDELELDHTCRVRCCVNPDHLDPVTHEENMRRTRGLRPPKPYPIHCRNGHDLTAENLTLRKSGGWRCRICHREAERARLATYGRRKHFQFGEAA